MVSIQPEGETMSRNTVNYSVTIDEWNTNDTSSGNWYRISDNAQAISTTTSTQSPQQPGTDACNESLVHSNTEKAVFHSVKGAKRMLDEDQHQESLAIAGNAGKSFLEAEGVEYDPSKSEDYLESNFLDKFRSTETIIERAIEKAFSKIDQGNHKGGARIAVSLADEFLEGFTAP